MGAFTLDSRKLTVNATLYRAARLRSPGVAHGASFTHRGYVSPLALTRERKALLRLLLVTPLIRTLSLFTSSFFPGIKEYELPWSDQTSKSSSRSQAKPVSSCTRLPASHLTFR